MNAIEFLRSSFETSSWLTLKFADDLCDAPLAFPTSKGGNHPLWIMGHITLVESMFLNEMAFGRANPLSDWRAIFGPESSPVADASKYPSYDTVMTAFKTTREQTLKTLATLIDADLDNRSCAPEQFKKEFGRVGDCYKVALIHASVHTGQLTDVRRNLGREYILFASPEQVKEAASKRVAAMV